MAIKKSELYSSLWASCDELRGGMDASQYKDYVLVLLFIKYVSDKYAGVPYAPITVPKGASFKDMVALKGKPSIGDDINKKIIEPIAAANKISDWPDFADPNKLGSGKEMVDRLTNLIAIFEKPELDFSKNRAEGDDILGDAYEYLMRHFATESGKSKGQFYTPAEVSRIMARVIGISRDNTTAQTTVYDPTCGSGSLLLKVADAAGRELSLFGQENDNPTATLARMNMVLHNSPTADIQRGNTLANPKYLDDRGRLKTFNFVVANPPFSYKSWSNGIDALHDPFERFKDYGIPPNKNGDYAFLLHILRSLRINGKGAVILPHGVLFRGNAEAEIRKNIIIRGFIKGIIGLPANLFYGTGIPACIIVIDKENAEHRKGIFMIDASKGFMKDGNKNRLREQDIHKIIDVFTKQSRIEKYSRMVPVTEIADEKNDYNLNLTRYIDSQEPEDLQDIEAHLKGDIPNYDVDALNDYWDVYPTMKAELFGKSNRSGYSHLKIEKDKIKPTIFNHLEFLTFTKKMDKILEKWKNQTIPYLKDLKAGCKPKQVIYKIAEDILDAYTDRPLINKYDVYQHLMDYWNETMQDDMYELAVDGWKAGKEVTRIMKETKNNKKEKVRKEVEGIEGLEGRLIPPKLLIEVFFSQEQKGIDDLIVKKESVQADMEEMREEHGDDEGLLLEVLDEKNKINRKAVQQRLKDIGEVTEDNKDEMEALQKYLQLMDDEAALNAEIKKALMELETKIIKKYPALTEAEIKTIVVEQKWMVAISKDVKNEMDRVSQRLTNRIKELADRYESTLPELSNRVDSCEKKVNAHLKKMGFQWN